MAVACFSLAQRPSEQKTAVILPNRGERFTLSPRESARVSRKRIRFRQRLRLKLKCSGQGINRRDAESQSRRGENNQRRGNKSRRLCAMVAKLFWVFLAQFFQGRQGRRAFGGFLAFAATARQFDAVMHHGAFKIAVVVGAAGANQPVFRRDRRA